MLRIASTTGTPAEVSSSIWRCGGAMGGADDEPRRPLLAHQAQQLGLADGILAGIGDEGDEARGLEDALDADRHIGEEGIAEVVDDHADDGRAGLAQIGRRAVVDIAQRLDRHQDLGPGLGLHHGTALEDKGDRRLRHPGMAGDVDDGGSRQPSGRALDQVILPAEALGLRFGSIQ